MLDELEIGRTGIPVEFDWKDERKDTRRGEHPPGNFSSIIIVSYVCPDDRQDLFFPSVFRDGDAANYADVLVGGILGPRPGFIDIN